MPVQKRYPQTMLATALLPWKPDYTLHEPLFKKQIEHIVSSGVKHVYIFGTAGEGYDMDTADFAHIVEIFAQEMAAPGLHPMVCLISYSTRLVIERIGIAYKLGIREFQLTLPSWGVLDDEEMMVFYHAVCDKFPDCKFIIYNIPRCGKVLELLHYQRIAAEIPNIVAAKHTFSNTAALHGLLSSDCPLQFFLHESGWAYGSQVGECGYLVALCASNFKIAEEFFNAGLQGNIPKLKEIEAMVFDIMDHLLKTVGKGMDGSYDKMTNKLALPGFPLLLRPPYKYPSDEAFMKHRDYIKCKYPHFLI